MTQQNVTPPPAAGEPALPRLQLSNLQLFLTFSRLALLGFGGVLPQAYHQIVERKKWMTPAEFAEMLVFCQIMPGPTICTVALIFGYRQNGMRGAIASLGGMVLFPFIIIMVLGILYQQYNDIALVRDALRGMSVVAAGVAMSMGLKILIGLPRTTRNYAIAGCVLAGIALFKLPLLWVLGVMGPLAVYLQYRANAAAAKGAKS